MTYYNFDRLENLKDGDILFFDELLNGNPTVLNACLTILEQRRMISGKPLPDIMIVAAANPQGMCPLTPQIKERFIWYDLQFDKEMWGEYMTNKYATTKSINDKLSQLIKEEKYIDNNFNSPRSIDKNISMLLNDVPTPYDGRLRPILSEMVVNPLDGPVQLDENTQLLPNEMIEWFKLVKFMK